MEQTIKQLVEAHNKLMNVEAKGQSAVSLVEGLTTLTQVINTLIAENNKDDEAQSNDRKSN